MVPDQLNGSSLPQPVPTIKRRWQNEKKYWIIWLLISVTVFAVFCSTLAIAPFLHKDEFLIVDLGRTILHPGTDWSIAWMSDSDQPVFIWSYIGPVIQEFAFTSLGQYGPRISGIAGAIVAATFLVKWLLARNVAPVASMLLGIIFLLDPLFVQSYTMGRVDGWAMAMILAACWVTVKNRKNSPGSPAYLISFALACLLSTAGIITWPSAVFLLPLLLQELYMLFNKQGKTAVVRNFLWFGFGTAIATLLILLPVMNAILPHAAGMLKSLRMNTAEYKEVQETLSTTLIHSALEVFRVLKFTLPLFLAGTYALIRKKQKALSLALVFPVVLMVSTLVYIHRVQYLVPYLVVALGTLYIAAPGSGIKTQWKYFTDLRLMLPIVWCISLSLVARTILAFEDYHNKGRELVYRAAHQMIGGGAYPVFSTYEFYYAGRAMGWKMYKPYMLVGERNSTKKLEPVLLRVNQLIVNESEITETLLRQLKENGFAESERYSVYAVPSPVDDGITDNIRRLRNLYSIYNKPYGPYRVFKKPEP